MSERDLDDRRGEDLDLVVEQEFASCWEVRGYFSEEDYETRSGVLIDEFIDTKSQAEEIAKENIVHYAVIKIQTHDREEIEIIRKSK